MEAEVYFNSFSNDIKGIIDKFPRLHFKISISALCFSFLLLLLQVVLDKKDGGSESLK